MKVIGKCVMCLLVIASNLPMQAQAAQDAMSRAEARQTVEDKTPQAQYQTSKREANAAYQEALAECKKMSGIDRTSCMKEARANLQNDLAEARRMVSTGQ